MGADYFILEAEKSSELVAAFRLLAEAVEDGQPRFSAEACRAVERAIACRTYASALLELSHLAHAASAYRGRYFELFWAPGPMRPARLRALFATCADSAGGWLAIGPAEIELVYPDGRFSIAYGRMPVLVAFAEFLLTALGFAAVDAILAPLAAPHVTAAEVSRQANALSRLVYDYLKDHLPPVQTQRKLTAIVDFLTRRHGGDFDIAAVDDDAVLAFWRAAASDAKAPDFRTFASVFLAFARFRQVFACAETIGAVERARPIGADADAGEVDPADIAAAVELAAPETNPLQALLAPPSARIKFFNAKERDGLALLFQCGPATADALPLSFSRCEVFGRAQARISQSLRGGAGANRMPALLADPPDEDYRGHHQRLREIAAHGRRLLLAAAHVMNASGRPLADALRRLGPELGGARAAADDPDLDAFLAEARRAARQIARQGFRPDEIRDDDVQAGFVAGCPLVAEIVDRLERFLDRLAALKLPDGDWDAQFQADARIFAACFHEIYGEAP